MNLIFTAFATLEGYREGSNANLGSEVFYRCIVVSLVSAKQKNQNCDAALVTNTAVPEPYAAQLSRAGVRVIACPFDNYRFEADLDWSLAYYKLCAMQYLLETEHYENYLMLDSDTFTQRGYQDIWREAAEAVLLYQVPHAASQPMTARISHTYDELWPEGAPHVLTHFGGEFVAGSTARLQGFMAECRNVFDRMQQTRVPGKAKMRQLTVLYHKYTRSGRMPENQTVWRLCCLPAARPPLLRSLWVRLRAKIGI